MSAAEDLLLELNELTRELRVIAAEGVPSAGQTLGNAERLRAEAAQAIRVGRRGEKSQRDKDARDLRREEFAGRVAEINTRLDEIDILLIP